MTFVIRGEIAQVEWPGLSVLMGMTRGSITAILVEKLKV